MIDELAHAGPEHLDEAFVAGYDRKQGYPDPAEDLAAVRHRAWDGGAWSWTWAGHRAVRARRGPAVRAGDRGGRLAGHGRPAARARGRAGLGNLTACGPVPQLTPHAGPPADGVYTRHALHQLPDFWKAMAL